MCVNLRIYSTESSITRFEKGPNKIPLLGLELHNVLLHMESSSRDIIMFFPNSVLIETKPGRNSVLVRAFFLEK